jgi:hypothetical protein
MYRISKPEFRVKRNIKEIRGTERIRRKKDIQSEKHTLKAEN